MNNSDSNKWAIDAASLHQIPIECITDISAIGDCKLKESSNFIQKGQNNFKISI